jgi:Tol biopolymer transport system component
MVDKRDQEPAIRLVWSGPQADTYGAPSPDGKYLSFVDWSSGDLAIRDLVTGKNRRLTNKGSWEQNSSEEAEFSIWSPDGKQIAFQWMRDAGRRVELRVIGLDGSKSRTLYSAGEDEWAELYDWSPDGNYILASLPERRLSLISVADGSIRVLRELKAESTRAAFSPDGRYIVFDAPQAGDSLKRDIHTLSTEGNHEILLVAHSADERVLGWAPNGKAVLFASDRTGSQALWVIAVADGRAQGTPQLIRTTSGRTVPLGFSRDGRFFYGESKAASDIYTVRLDPTTGKVLGPPEKIIDRFEGFNFMPSYSPDGKYLAYCSWRGGKPSPTHGNVLCIHSMETGEDQEFSKELKNLGVTSISKPRWAPDGKSILIYGYAKPAVPWGGIYVVNLHTRAITEVLYSGDDVRVTAAGWSSDGKSIIFFRFDKKESLYHLVTRNLETGSEKTLYELPESANPYWEVSPDFQRLCILTQDRGQRALWIMKATGREPLKLHEFAERRRPAWLTWAADGKCILFTRKDEAAGWQLWRLSVDAGEPELLGLAESSYIAHLSAHPDGERIVFSRGPLGGAEIWVMENFLPADR